MFLKMELFEFAEKKKRKTKNKKEGEHGQWEINFRGEVRTKGVKGNIQIIFKINKQTGKDLWEIIWNGNRWPLSNVKWPNRLPIRSYKSAKQAILIFIIRMKGTYFNELFKCKYCKANDGTIVSVLYVRHYSGCSMSHALCHMLSNSFIT